MHRRFVNGLATLIVASSMACSISVSSAPQIIPKANVPYHLLNPPPTTTSTSLTPKVEVTQVVYFYSSKQVLTPVQRDIQIPATLTELLGALLDGPTQYESAIGLENYLTGAASDVSAVVTKGLATVNFQSNPFQLLTEQSAAVAQVVYTATSLPDVTSVQVEIAGSIVDVPTAAGTNVSRPVTRADFPIIPAK